ncbi:ABC transporter permease [Flagellimonas sp. W118]|uniref:ABC transporter permease n=1 Tax=Flagellimonas sp. W118 TaxID=3410791 RepID=UPI003BF4E1A5
MIDKLRLIIKREYLAKVRNKSFIVMTILSPILIVGMIVLIAFLTDINDNEKRVISVLNQSDFFQNEFTATKNTSYVQFQDLSLDEAKDSTIALGYYGLIHVPSSENLEKTASRAYLFTQDNPNTNVIGSLENIFQRKLRQKRLEGLGVSSKEFSSIEKPFALNLASFDGEKSVKGINEIKAFIGGVFGYAIMMFIIIYGGFVMRSVIEEKTSRIIEVIIASVKPFQLMLGKIIGTSLAGITQFAIWIVSASLLLFISMLVFKIDLSALSNEANLATPGLQGMPELDSEMMLYAKEIIDIPWTLLIGSFLVYFILGYLIYSSIYAAIGAAVDNETDTQQFIFPIILPLMLAIYVGFFSVFSNPHGPIAVGFSLFPLTSPIVMLMRLPGGIGEGGVPLWQLLLSITFLIITFLGIVSLAAKIYRIGILMYGKRPTYKELFKWLRY